MNKLTYFQSLVYSKSVDCFCVTESWLSSNIGDSEILPSNYKLYRCDREERGGGVLIAVSDQIPSRQLTLNANSEMVLIELALTPKLVICCSYTSPSCSDCIFDAAISNLEALPVDCDVLVAGDFNAPDIDWGSQSASSHPSVTLFSIKT